MNEENIIIRQFESSDEETVIALWRLCNLVVPHNDPKSDIIRKQKVQPELFLVGLIKDNIVATIMAGYEGHRGWINYLAVVPERRYKGIGRAMVEETEKQLRKLGCPKINLQIRSSNKDVIKFYKKMGFSRDDVISMGKRLS